MSGSHTAALDFCMQRIPERSRVVDIGAGMSPLAGWLAHEKNCDVLALDIDSDRLVRAWKAAAECYRYEIADAARVQLATGFYDYAVALFSLQHMIGYEPLVWVRIRQWLKREGKMIASSRYALNSPRYEGDRGDPLISQDQNTIGMLAAYCGFQVLEIRPYCYGNAGFSFEPIGSARANAVIFVLKAS